MSQHDTAQKVTDLKKVKEPGIYTDGVKIITCTGKEEFVDQAEQYQTDLNKLLEPAMRKGLIRHSVKFAGQYDDIPAADLQDAMNIIANANTMYEQLPANIREEFRTPKQFLTFVQNPKNAEQHRS